MNAARDLFTDHSTEQEATEGAIVGRRTPGGRDTAPSAPAAVTTNTPSDEAPAAAVQDRQRGTGQTPDREGGERLPLSGAAVETCGTCGESSPWIAGMLNCAQLGHWHHMSSGATCTFQVSRWKPIDAASLARRAAQLGIDQAAEAADRTCNGWTERAFEFVKAFAEQNRGRAYIGHDIVQAAKVSDLPRPENEKAWGQPIQRAARTNIIVKDGFGEDPNRHGNPVIRWRTV